MEQYQFDFNQWKEAFEMFYRKRLGYKVYNEKDEFIGKVRGNPNIHFIVSLKSEVEGYWIEEKVNKDKETLVHYLLYQIRALEKKLIEYEKVTGKFYTLDDWIKAKNSVKNKENI